MDYDYDIIFIGGGAAGLSGARLAAKTGAQVALIEKDKIGGTCNWSGCIPSKTLLRSAKIYNWARQVREFGVDLYGDVHYDTGGVMSHVRSIIMKMSQLTSPEYLQASGIAVLPGTARFVDAHTITNREREYRARQFVICAGSEPIIPPIPGLSGIDYLVSKDLWTLGYLPTSLAVLGGGPIAV